MDNGRLNNLQLYKSKWFSGLVDENMLSNALLVKPHVVTPILSYVFGNWENNALDFLTKGTGRVQTIENREFEWMIMGEDEKAMPIVKVINQSGVEIPANATSDTAYYCGINNTMFKIYLREKWFGAGAILAMDNRNYRVRVMNAPYQDGEYFVYNVQIANGDPTSFVPYQNLLPGSEVSRDGSAYEEYSDEADITNYATPFKLKNQLTTLRQSYEISRDAYSSYMVIAVKGDNGKESYLWSTWQEWQALKQWYKTIDKTLMYGEYNARPNGTVDLLGTNGRPVYMGAGLRQQIAPANKRNFTTLTTNIIDDFLFDISYNSMAMGNRKYVALTGEMGMREFDRVIKEKASAYNLIDTHFVSGSGQDLTLAGQFTTYKMLNGIELTLKHFPLYDNTITNRQLHPITKRPLESYRMTFLDFSMVDGESNIVKMVRKDAEMVMWHTAGSTAPGIGTSKSISTLRANSKDGYAVHFLSELGLMVRNPLSCGELVCTAQD